MSEEIRKQALTVLSAKMKKLKKDVEKFENIKKEVEEVGL